MGKFLPVIFLVISIFLGDGSIHAQGIAEKPGLPGTPSSQKPQASQDSLASSSKTGIITAATPKSRSDSVMVVKHSFNHRQQIITGSVVMACLALVMVTMNNYNPR